MANKGDNQRTPEEEQTTLWSGGQSKRGAVSVCVKIHFHFFFPKFLRILSEFFCILSEFALNTNSPIRAKDKKRHRSDVLQVYLEFNEAINLFGGNSMRPRIVCLFAFCAPRFSSAHGSDHLWLFTVTLCPGREEKWIVKWSLFKKEEEENWDMNIGDNSRSWKLPWSGRKSEDSVSNGHVVRKKEEELIWYFPRDKGGESWTGQQDTEQGWTGNSGRIVAHWLPAVND